MSGSTSPRPSATGDAISVSHLSKEYHVLDRGQQHTTSVEAAFSWLRNPRGGPAKRRLMALDDVSFDVGWGEIVGIIGRNGAGKSTLLKVLTRITAPTKGRAELAGRIGSLLEIGTGFHPELTGRENVFLNGTLLGMRKKEIERRFDEIVEFAGVERFLDTQVKRFSTGMYVRLAFGVAAHLQTEILVVDEVLAVGDADFQAKCLRKMREVAHSGRTVLLVSHQLQTVSALATRGLYLRDGTILHDGDMDSTLAAYKTSFEEQPTDAQLHAAMRPGSGALRFEKVSAVQPAFEPDEDKVIDFTLTPNPELRVPLHIGCHVVDENHVAVAQCDSRLVEVFVDGDSPVTGRLRIRSPWMKPGRYSVDMFLSSYAEITDQWEHATVFEVTSTLPYPGAAPDRALAHSPVLADFSYDLS